MPERDGSSLGHTYRSGAFRITPRGTTATNINGRRPVHTGPTTLYQRHKRAIWVGVAILCTAIAGAILAVILLDHQHHAATKHPVSGHPCKTTRGTPPNQTCAEACSTHADCDDSKVCQPSTGACVACTTGAHCRNGEGGDGESLCIAGVCEPTCDGPEDCAQVSGKPHCATRTYVDDNGESSTTKVCVACISNDDCPASAGQPAPVCDVAASFSCVTCDKDLACADGYHCVKGACVTGCTSDADCGTGTVCDAVTSACVTCVAGTSQGCAAPQVCNATGTACVACTSSNQCPNAMVCHHNVCVLPAALGIAATLGTLTGTTSDTAGATLLQWTPVATSTPDEVLPLPVVLNPAGSSSLTSVQVLHAAEGEDTWAVVFSDTATNTRYQWAYSISTASFSFGPVTSASMAFNVRFATVGAPTTYLTDMSSSVNEQVYMYDVGTGATVGCTSTGSLTLVDANSATTVWALCGLASSTVTVFG